MGGKLLFLPGEVLQTGSRKSESRSNNELQEVSRGHSTLILSREGPNNRKSQVQTGRRTVC